MNQQQLTIIRIPEQLENLHKYLEDKTLIAIDTETTGVDLDCNLIGVSVCAEEGEAFYIVISEWLKDENRLRTNATLKQLTGDLLQSILGKNIIMHNAVFDARVISDTYKIDIISSVAADTMVMAHLVDEEGPKALKELGALYFGQEAKKEQGEMKTSVLENGGIWQDGRNSKKEMFKADPNIIGKYGAKDAWLTYALFYILSEKLDADNLLGFFFTDECMPLLRGPTYDMNTTGLKVDVQKLTKLKQEMEHEIERINQTLKEDLSGYTEDRPKFNLGSTQHLAWLLFIRLNFCFRSLNPTGKALAKSILGKMPYTPTEKKRFIKEVLEERKKKEVALREMAKRIDPIIKNNKEAIAILRKQKRKDPDNAADYDADINKILAENKQYKTPWTRLASEINKLCPEKLIQVDKETLKDLAVDTPWINRLLKLKSEEKLLGTYVEGILSKLRYGVINPRFNQVGTDSGRYSSSEPNFQNLPRDDKRVKSCIVARKGKVFVGADYSQLEPRVFSSVSKDPRLLDCFDKGEDFYSVVGIGIFDRQECSTFKNDDNSFASLYPEERQISKNTCLAAAYGTTAYKQAKILRKPDGTNMSVEECQNIIDSYFDKFPDVRQMMLDSHDQAKKNGVVYNLFGRPRRLPEAVRIGKMFPKVEHKDLDYEHRTILNLAMNFRVQSTAASIVNRASIACWYWIKGRSASDPRWKDVKIVLQVHDELVLEGPEELSEDMANGLQDCMETAVDLPGVKLIASPKVAKSLADLK